MLSQFFNGPADMGGGEIEGFPLVDPDDIAKAVVYLLSEDSAKISGINMPVGDSAP